jgi:hypothetical protein
MPNRIATEGSEYVTGVNQQIRMWHEAIIIMTEYNNENSVTQLTIILAQFMA